MKLDSVKIMFSWIEKMEEGFSQQDIDTVIGKLVRYAKDGEIVYSEDKPYLNPMIKEYCSQIDNMYKGYQERVEYGKKVGRKSTYSDEENEEIYRLAKQGLKVKAIAQKLGIEEEKKIKAIYNTKGWNLAKKELKENS